MKRLIGPALILVLLVGLLGFRSTSAQDGPTAVTNALASATSLTILPSGDILIGLKSGQIRKHTPGTFGSSVWASVGPPPGGGPSNSQGTSGLLALEYHDGVVYVFHVARFGQSSRVRWHLTKFDVNGTRIGKFGWGDDLVNWWKAGGHVGGDLVVHNGYLYATTGDDLRATTHGRDWSSHIGKAVRWSIGSVSGNPQIWSAGLKNPYRAVSTGSRLFVGDVGKETWEAVEEATQSGQDFGWPITGDGPHTNPCCANPVLGYRHTGSNAPNPGSAGMTAISSTGFALTGLAWDGVDVLITDHVGGWLGRWNPTTDAYVEQYPPGTFTKPSDIEIASNGDIYVVSLNTGLWVLDGGSAPPPPPPPPPPPDAPTVTVTVGVEDWANDDEIQYSASAVDDEDGNVSASVEWEIRFGHDDSSDGSGEHYHPYLDGISGPTGSFVADVQGHASENVWWELIARATDSEGKQGMGWLRVYPRLSELTVSAPGTVLVDGEETASPITIRTVEGVSFEVVGTPIGGARPVETGGGGSPSGRVADPRGLWSIADGTATTFVGPQLTEHAGYWTVSPGWAGEGLTEYTLEAWVTPTATDMGRIAGWRSTSPSGVWNVVISQGWWALDNQYAARGRGVGSYSSVKINNAGQVSTGQPQHVLLTNDGSTARMYVDGVQVRTDASTAPRWHQPGGLKFAIGASDDGTEPFDGEIHLVAFYDRALTPAEVTANFDAGH